MGCTMGPKGKTVFIEQEYGYPKVTKDGVTVAQSISSVDSIENMAIQIVIQAATSIAKKVGDGTTTISILIASMYKEFIKYSAVSDSLLSIRDIKKRNGRSSRYFN